MGEAVDLSQVKRWFGGAVSLSAQSHAGRAPGALARPAARGAEAMQPQAELALWNKARVEVVEQLWGEGFVHPGGIDELLHMINPMGLSGADTLLLLGAGPFGAARSITTARQCWVESYERDPDLQALASHRAELAGLKKRAPTHLLEPVPQFRAKSASHTLCWQALIDDASVAPLLSGVAAATRPGGQLVMVELVADGAMQDGIERRWMRLEGRDTPPPKTSVVVAELKRLGFDVRIAEDMSANHVSQAISGWQSMLGAIATQRPSVKQAGQMVGEAEIWMLRMKLLGMGRLRLMRWQAIRR